jgi:hypothetical protein
VEFANKVGTLMRSFMIRKNREGVFNCGRTSCERLTDKRPGDICIDLREDFLHKLRLVRSFVTEFPILLVSCVVGD